MNKDKRRCANCCAVTADGLACMNLMGAEFSPENVCALHETPAEFDADMAAIHLLRRFTQHWKPGAASWGPAHD